MSKTRDHLWGCNKITDEGLKGLGQECPDLETIILRGCNKITDEGLNSLCKKCLKLKEIDLSYGCPLVTEECRASLRLQGIEL